MRRTAAVLAVLTAFGLAIGGVASAGGDPLVGTWHERDEGTSNIFWFIEEAVDGVLQVTYYDDHTGNIVCPDNGPMLWAGFAVKTNETTLEGSFGSVRCQNGDELTELVPEGGGDPIDVRRTPFTIEYDPETDTISRTDDRCPDTGTRQPEVNTITKAIQELEKGKYPESPGPLSCDQ